MILAGVHGVLIMLYMLLSKASVWFVVTFVLYLSICFSRNFAGFTLLAYLIRCVWSCCCCCCCFFAQNGNDDNQDDMFGSMNGSTSTSEDQDHQNSHSTRSDNRDSHSSSTDSSDDSTFGQPRRLMREGPSSKKSMCRRFCRRESQNKSKKPRKQA